MSWLTRCAALAAVSLSLVAGSAHAQDEGGGKSAVRQPGGLLDRSSQERSPMLSFFGILPWWYGFGAGVGARYTLPIVPNGFINEVNDSVELEFGGDVWFANYGFGNLDVGYTGLAIPAEGRWTFHITPKFSAYAKVGVGLVTRFWNDDVNDNFAKTGLYFDSTLGALYELNDSLSLRAEAGYAGLKAGVGIKF
jgi:hypothetical protein